MLILLLSVPTHLYVTTVSPLTIVPLLISLDVLHSIPFWIHLFVSALDFETESSNYHYKCLNFVSTTAVLSCSFSLESIFCSMTPLFLMLVYLLL